MRNFCFTLFGAIFLLNSMDVQAICDDDLNPVLAGIRVAPPELSISSWDGGAIFIGEIKFSLVRDLATGKIIGIRDSNDRVTSVNTEITSVNLAGGEKVILKKHGKSASQNGGSNSGVDKGCGGGTSSYFSDIPVLDRVEITETSVQTQPFWQETVLPLFGLGLPVEISGSGDAPPSPPPPKEDKEKKCTAATNSCLSRAASRSTNGAAACLIVSQEMTGKVGSRWGWLKVAAAAALCVYSAEEYAELAKAQCFAKHAECMAAN